jgi:hypothetical protein
VASDASFMRGDNTLSGKLLKGAIEQIDRDRFLTGCKEEMLIGVRDVRNGL